MQLKLPQLTSHLKNKLASVYLLHGDEPLLRQEARTAIRQSAETRGFLQRELLQVDASFDWSHFISLTQNYGLFSDKSVIELLNPNGKFDSKGSEALLNYVDNINDDILLVISTGKLTPAQQKTRWYKAMTKVGVSIPIWPIQRKDLPAWIQTRLQRNNLKADHASVQLLADLTEGNLLATQQAIDKMQLLFPGQTITQQQVLHAISDSARYNVFDLVNYILQGNCTQVLRVLNRLRQEGVEAILVLWAITRETRTLIQYARRLQQGEPMNQVLQKEWYSRKDLLKYALPRLNLEPLNQILQRAASVDQIIKGLQVGDPWLELQNISLALAGKPILKVSLNHD